jgi:hypothetical protein
VILALSSLFSSAVLYRGLEISIVKLFLGDKEGEIQYGEQCVQYLSLTKRI